MPNGKRWRIKNKHKKKKAKVHFSGLKKERISKVRKGKVM